MFVLGVAMESFANPELVENVYLLKAWIELEG